MVRRKNSKAHSRRNRSEQYRGRQRELLGGNRREDCDRSENNQHVTISGDATNSGLGSLIRLEDVAAKLSSTDKDARESACGALTYLLTRDSAALQFMQRNMLGGLLHILKNDTSFGIRAEAMMALQVILGSAVAENVAQSLVNNTEQTEAISGTLSSALQAVVDGSATSTVERVYVMTMISSGFSAVAAVIYFEDGGYDLLPSCGLVAQYLSVVSMDQKSNWHTGMNHLSAVMYALAMAADSQELAERWIQPYSAEFTATLQSCTELGYALVQTIQGSASVHDTGEMPLSQVGIVTMALRAGEIEAQLKPERAPTRFARTLEPVVRYALQERLLRCRVEAIVAKPPSETKKSGGAGNEDLMERQLQAHFDLLMACVNYLFTLELTTANDDDDAGTEFPGTAMMSELIRLQAVCADQRLRSTKTEVKETIMEELDTLSANCGELVTIGAADVAAEPCPEALLSELFSIIAQRVISSTTLPLDQHRAPVLFGLLQQIGALGESWRRSEDESVAEVLGHRFGANLRNSGSGKRLVELCVEILIALDASAKSEQDRKLLDWYAADLCRAIDFFTDAFITDVDTAALLAPHVLACLDQKRSLELAVTAAEAIFTVYGRDEFTPILAQTYGCGERLASGLLCLQSLQNDEDAMNVATNLKAFIEYLKAQ
eukprot:Clim_evm9s200 gene=Clim_evmTU9s200